MNERADQLQRLRTMHLFAGAGGGILGDILLGHQPVCAVEINSYCQQVLAARQKDGCFPFFPIFADVTQFDGRPWKGLVDVVAGGFPCTDLSVAGKGAGIDGPQSGLWKEQIRIIREVRPRFVFVENSPALTIRGLGTVLADLAALGFDAQWGVLSCADVGGVHLRERIWILGTNDRRERGQRFQQKQVFRFSRFPWGENVRGIEDLRNRSDLPEPLVRRIGHDVAFGMDRLKAIGNGQVPRLVPLSFRILSQ